MRLRWVVCLLVSLIACDPSEKPSSNATPSPTASRSSMASPSPSPSPSRTPEVGNCRNGAATPRPIVASRRARIVLLRASDGKELCTLAMVDPQSRTTFDVEMAPHSGIVYFSDGGLGHCGNIYSISIGGPIREVARSAYGPAISPDGRRLAYNASHSCGDRRHRIVVRDIDDGTEREWIGTWEGGYGNPSWAPDARFLIVVRGGSDSARHFLLDTRKTGPLDGRDWPPVDEDDRPAGIEISSPGVTLTSPTVRPGTRTVAFGVAYSDVDGSERYPVLEYDPMRDTYRVLISDNAWPIVYDPSGESLLIMRRGTTKLKLFRYTNGRTFFLGKGFHDASW